MLDFIEGNVIEKNDNFIIVFVAGFGLKILTPDNFNLGINKIYTHLSFKDDEFKLFGFKDEKRKLIFKKLINVNGIGVKNAFSILSSLSTEQIIQAIETQDTGVFSSVQGIGRKTAQRIILELKGKIDFDKNSKMEDILLALENLGFDRKTATPIVIEIMKNTTSIEDIIKLSLQKLTEKR